MPSRSESSIKQGKIKCDSRGAGYGPENLAGVRRLVVNIARLMDDKLSFRRRLLRAAQDPEYRLELIANAAKLAEAL